MRSNQSHSTAKAAFAIVATLLLAATLATQPAQAQTFKVLHTFHGSDGQNPIGQFVRDAAGNIYGTTGEGGSNKCGHIGCGTAFKMNKAGKLLWLHSFKGANGETPNAGLLRDAAGYLYGTTVYGGDLNCLAPYGCGTVFKLDRTGKETVLHKFEGTPDGWLSDALLVRNSAGNLYGTTINGGVFDNAGVAFRVDSNRHETVLYSFCSETNCADGNTPSSGVILDRAGNIYGVTGSGGVYDAGVVFELDTTGKETVLYSFTGYSGGRGPLSVLIADSAGNLYGTTTGGGNLACGGGDGCGVVFELSPQSDGSWTETTLYTFCSLSNCADGRLPFRGPLVRTADGTLYGTTSFGGNSTCNGSGCGVVFKLDTTGKETVLHSFTGGSDGSYPYAGLTMDSTGSLYGSALGSNTNCQQGCGTIFKITP